MACEIEFIECSSLSISYDVLGLATVSFTVVANCSNVDLTKYRTITVGDATYRGYLTAVTAKPIISTSWWEFSVSLVMTSTR